MVLPPPAETSGHPTFTEAIDNCVLVLVVCDCLLCCLLLQIADVSRLFPLHWVQCVPLMLAYPSSLHLLYLIKDSSLYQNAAVRWLLQSPIHVWREGSECLSCREDLADMMSGHCIWMWLSSGSHLVRGELRQSCWRACCASTPAGKKASGLVQASMFLAQARHRTWSMLS